MVSTLTIASRRHVARADIAEDYCFTDTSELTEELVLQSPAGVDPQNILWDFCEERNG